LKGSELPAVGGQMVDSFEFSKLPFKGR